MKYEKMRTQIKIISDKNSKVMKSIDTLIEYLKKEKLDSVVESLKTMKPITINKLTKEIEKAHGYKYNNDVWKNGEVFNIDMRKEATMTKTNKDDATIVKNLLKIDDFSKRLKELYKILFNTNEEINNVLKGEEFNQLELEQLKLAKEVFLKEYNKILSNLENLI